MGDQVLQHVAQRLSGLVRKSDTTARLGGDEFAIMLINAGVDEMPPFRDKLTSQEKEDVIAYVMSL